MRRLALVIVLAGCPSSQSPNSSDGGGDDGSVTPDGATCTAIPTCTATIRSHVSGTNVVLHGDFAPDGWTTGVPMTATADGFEATLPVANKQIIVYKLVVDGTWVPDPDNPRRSPDGYGGFNSVMRVACDHCPTRAAIDWRDAIMYFVVVDRFADGNPANNAPVPGVEYPGQYQGGDWIGLREKIDAGYFNDLGINTLWITSPIDNADGANPGSDGHIYSGYHGYWPSQLDLPESKLGTEDELRAMVDAAHSDRKSVV